MTVFVHKYIPYQNSASKEIKKLKQKACRTARANYTQDLISDDKDNKKLQSYIKSKKKDNTGTSDLKSGQTIIQDPKTKALANIFNAFSPRSFPMPALHNPPMNMFAQTPCPRSPCPKLVSLTYY